jgi:hypothetical protein
LVLQKDSIANTSFRLNGLKADTDYTYSVQAINDQYRNSSWAESESFRPNPDAISDISKSIERIRVYDIKGRFVGECFADELHRFSLRHGIFVIRRSNGDVKKLLIQ